MFFSEKVSLMLSLAHNSSVHLGAGTHKKKCPYCEKETKGLEYHEVFTILRKTINKIYSENWQIKKNCYSSLKS